MASVSSEYFVLKPSSMGLPDGLPTRAVGSTGLFVFRSPCPEATPRQQWDQLICDYSHLLDFAAPLIIDDKGREMLPTGNIVVQFKRPFTVEVLQKFESTYRLHCLRSNEFVPNELIFQLVGNDVYLPDLIAQLTSDSNVTFAAPETLARYSSL